MWYQSGPQLIRMMETRTVFHEIKVYLHMNCKSVPFVWLPMNKHGCLIDIKKPIKYIRITPSHNEIKEEEIRIYNPTESSIAFKVDSTRKHLLIPMPKYGIINPKSEFYLKIQFLKLRTSNFDYKHDYLSVYMIVAPKEKTWKKPTELWKNDSILTEPMITYVIEVGYNKQIEGKLSDAESGSDNSERLESGQTMEKAVKNQTESETFPSTNSTTYYSALNGFESGSSIYYTAKNEDYSESKEDTASVGKNGMQNESGRKIEEQCCEK
ncbi:hypothetical protein T07_4704 [Trichinella nelsoni]|uniref:Major sperm protein n=1 Tax=Trichinella nelsoni TaxID=6336 RepID=A0A0V0RTZ4_9BILA|nr:hypothetical protein T07_4704 [Trichinella nelsoni]